MLDFRRNKIARLHNVTRQIFRFVQQRFQALFDSKCTPLCFLYDQQCIETKLVAVTVKNEGRLSCLFCKYIARRKSIGADVIFIESIAGEKGRREGRLLLTQCMRLAGEENSWVEQRLH